MDEQRNPVIFSEWLKHRRKTLDLTQDELAKRVGCSVGALRKIESGDRRPSKQLAGILAQALEIPKEEQQTFIRVARGELNLERLQSPVLLSHTPATVMRATHHSPRRVIPDTTPVPSPIYRIPLEATPLVGRVNEIAALDRLFSDPQCRLLTLTGVGGIGKTRLAIEFATCSHPKFPGGIFYVPLASINSPDKIVPAIAEVLNFGFSGPTEPKEQLFNYLLAHIQQISLLVLDNLEHLLVQAPQQDDQLSAVELIAEILRRLPNVQILGTSRERLNLHGEWTYELHGLSIPPVNFTGGFEEYNSIALFLDSARRVTANFQVTPEEQRSITQICQMVDGVPLAIELAAAWVGVLSCQEIAREIQSNMDFLSTSMRGIPERHSSIRATFDHSWNLLSDEERRVLCQLSVFQGGFDRDAAQKIAGATLPLLASLSNKSLVRRAESGRYDLHEVIRQYALSHLNDDQGGSDTYKRYCEYYLAYTAQHEKALKTSAQQETIRRLTGEIDNIRAAWTCAIGFKQFAQLENAARAFGWYFEITGLLHEGREQLELLVQAVIAEHAADEWRRLLALMRLHQALYAFRGGVWDRACQLYEESIQRLRSVGDKALLAEALAYYGTIQHHIGEFVPSKDTLEEGLILARENQNPWIEAWCIYSLGYLMSDNGNPTEGYEQMEYALSIWRTIGDPFSITMAYNFSVTTLLKLGRYVEAKENMLESIALCEQTKNRWGMGSAYRFLGLATMATGQYAEAETYFLKSLEIFSDCAIGWDIARSLTYLGDAARMSGKTEKARRDYLDALSVSIDANTLPITMDAILGLCHLSVCYGNHEQALLMCYYLMDNPCTVESTKKDADQLRISLEPMFGRTQVSAIRTASAEITLNEIRELALRSPSA